MRPSSSFASSIEIERLCLGTHLSTESKGYPGRVRWVVESIHLALLGGGLDTERIEEGCDGIRRADDQGCLFCSEDQSEGITSSAYRKQEQMSGRALSNTHASVDNTSLLTVVD